MTDRPDSRLCILLKDRAEEAARFYASVLPDTHVDHVQPIGPGMAMVLWRCMGTRYTLMDGNEGSRPGPTIRSPSPPSTRTKPNGSGPRLRACSGIGP